MMPLSTYSDPAISVVSATPRNELIMGRLRQIGLRPVRATHDSPPNSMDLLLIDTVSIQDPALLNKLLNQVADAGEANVTIVLGPIPEAHQSTHLLHLPNIDQLSTLPARITIRQREIRRRREIELRAQTARTLGEPVQIARAVSNARLLYLGESSPLFMDLRASLKRHGIELVAALSHLTAQDYLASGGFHAMLALPEHVEDEATRYLLRYKRADSIQHIPHCLIEMQGMASFLPNSACQQVDKIIRMDQGEETLAQDIVTFVSTLTEVPRVPADRPSKAYDRISHLYSRAFMETHVDLQMNDADQTGLPLTLLAIEPKEGPGQLSTLARKIAAHLRDSDLMARLDLNHLCIVLPATGYRGAVTLARRIEENTGIDISWRAIERRQYHSKQTLLSALTARPTLKLRQRA